MRKRNAGLAIVGCAALLAAKSGMAATLTYTTPGAAMTWGTAGNWTPNQVPGAGDGAVVALPTGSPANNDMNAAGATTGDLSLSVFTGGTATMRMYGAANSTFTFDTNTAGATESKVTVTKTTFDSTFQQGLQVNTFSGPLKLVLNNNLRFSNAAGFNGSVAIQDAPISNTGKTITVESVDPAKTMGLRLRYSAAASAANTFTGTYVAKGNGFSTVGGVTTTSFPQASFTTSTACTNTRIFVRDADPFGAASNGIVLIGGTLDLYAGTQSTIPTTFARSLSGTGVVECRDSALVPLTFTGAINIGVSSVIGGAPDEINFFRGGAGVSVAAATLNVDAAVGLLTPGTYTILQQLNNFTFTGSTFAAMNLPSNVMVQPVLNGTGGVTAFQLVISQVPEPGMASIIGMGLLFAGYRRRRTG